MSLVNICGPLLHNKEVLYSDEISQDLQYTIDYYYKSSMHSPEKQILVSFCAFSTIVRRIASGNKIRLHLFRVQTFGCRDANSEFSNQQNC